MGYTCEHYKHKRRMIFTTSNGFKYNRYKVQGSMAYLRCVLYQNAKACKAGMQGRSQKSGSPGRGAHKWLLNSKDPGPSYVFGLVRSRISGANAPDAPP